jgi:very-short-patch-repair endonuclease
MRSKGILYQQARKFRKQPTESEDRLWRALRRNCYRYKFRRQHPLERFIVDIYHPASRLIIEVDGSAHDTRTIHDEERTRWLETCGYRVIRFSNDDINQQLDLVLDRIYAACAEPRQSEKAP